MRLINRSDVLAQMPRHRAAESPRDPLQMPAVPPTGREHERALVHAWREAHWAFRLKLEELARCFGITDLTPLYDEARRRDNELNDFYRLRAEALTKLLRDAVAGAQAIAARAPIPVRAADPSTTPPHPAAVQERVLIARFRALDAASRAALLRQAMPPAAHHEGMRGR